MIIKRGRVEHAPHIAELEKQCFFDPWSEAAIAHELNNRALTYYVVAYEKEELIGYGGLWIVGKEGHITNIAVAKEYRGQGIGRKIVFQLMGETDLPAYTLEVRESNKVAIALYEGLGFYSVGKRPKYYGKEDAIIMWRTLG